MGRHCNRCVVYVGGHHSYLASKCGTGDTHGGSLLDITSADVAVSAQSQVQIKAGLVPASSHDKPGVELMEPTLAGELSDPNNVFVPRLNMLQANLPIPDLLHQLRTNPRTQHLYQHRVL